MSWKGEERERRGANTLTATPLLPILYSAPSDGLGIATGLGLPIFGGPAKRGRGDCPPFGNGLGDGRIIIGDDFGDGRIDILGDPPGAGRNPAGLLYPMREGVPGLFGGPPPIGKLRGLNPAGGLKPAGGLRGRLGRTAGSEFGSLMADGIPVPGSTEIELRDWRAGGKPLREPRDWRCGFGGRNIGELFFL